MITDQGSYMSLIILIRYMLEKVTWQSKPWGWSCQLKISSTGFHPAVWNAKFSILFLQQIGTWWQGRTLDWRGREQGCKIWHWQVFYHHHLLGSQLLAPPEKWLKVLHACVIALLELVLVSLLVLLDKLTVPFQSISRLFQKVLIEYSSKLYLEYFGIPWSKA